MPTVDEIGAVGRTRFANMVAVPESLPTVYDNGVDEHADDAPWARFTFKPGASRMAELGARPSFRTIGTFVAQLFYPVETGDGLVLAMADVVASTFRRVTVSGVRFIVPSVAVVGRTSDNWWQVNVTCPFQCDETTT